MTPDTSAAPEEVFALLGNDLRMRILQALFEDPFHPLSFSTLRDRVDERDSGKFNYHLTKLVGRFVRKTDEGYELTLAGWKVIGAMLAGTYSSSGSIDPIDLDVACPECEGTVRLTYEDERMVVACVDCGEQLSSAGVPPGVFEEIPHVFEQWMHTLVDQAERGFCVSCSGRVVPMVVVDGEDPHIGTVDAPRVKYVCQRCPEVVSLSLDSALLGHPAVVGFHYDHGVDLRTTRAWTLDWTRDSEPVVESHDPLRVRVTVQLDDDTLDLVVDEDFEVCDVRDSRTH